MKVQVTQLYKNGKPIPRDKKLKVYVGDLSIIESKNPVLSRLVMEAMLFDGMTQVIAPMVDVRLISVSLDGMLLRGIEYGAGAQQVAQEWWVRLVK